MSALKYTNRLKVIDQYIRLKMTGRPDEFAEKLGISVKTLQNCINDLKELGAEIKFNNQRKTYVYKKKGELIIDFVLKKD